MQHEKNVLCDYGQSNLPDHRTTFPGFVQGLDGYSCEISENFIEFFISYANLKFFGR